MDSQDAQFVGSLNGFNFDGELFFPNSDQYPGLANGIKSNQPSYYFQSSFEGGDSPSDDSDGSDTVLKYINQVLMEEDMESKPCMFHDPLALQAAEKSFHELLGGKDPPSPDQRLIYIDQNIGSPDDNSSGNCSDHSSNCSSNFSNGNTVDSFWNHVKFGESKPSVFENPIPPDFVFRSTSKPSAPLSFNSLNSFTRDGYGILDSSVSKLVFPELFTEGDSVLQFNRGVEEASKFLPKGNQLMIDLESNKFSPIVNKKVLEVVVKTEIDEREQSPAGLRGRKTYERRDTELEDGRSNKQVAIAMDESELSEMFDKVLICAVTKEEPSSVSTRDEGLVDGNKNLRQNGQSNKSSGEMTRVKKQSNKNVVDLRTLMVLCAQAVSTDDRRTATEMLKQIRKHSSPFGDGSKRLAHCIANGLQARLDGTGTQIYTALVSKRTSAADMLKAHQTYVSACPFIKVAYIFANHTILQVAEKAETLHVIDFGILYGFQWPALLHCLSRRSGGPPKLRITGIELPQPGFRPAERVQDTGRRLAKYCERFGVPFEFNAIAQKWDTIRIEDLKINRNEVVAVNCINRFKNLLDETVVVNSPRNLVLKLIRKMNPDIFIQSIVNGSYNAPFFVSRFREALFHFSTLFDMLDATIGHEDPMRLMFEKEFYGREAMNVIACEGSERVERPETYKQWQVRITRAGFRQLPLERDCMKKLRDKVGGGKYHDDFVVNEDGHWMLQGWKGRIVHASSCWVPV